MDPTVKLPNIVGSNSQTTNIVGSNPQTTPYCWIPTLKVPNIFGSQPSNYPVSLGPTLKLPNIFGSNSQTTQYRWIPTLKLPNIVGSIPQKLPNIVGSQLGVGQHPTCFFNMAHINENIELVVTYHCCACVSYASHAYCISSYGACLNTRFALAAWISELLHFECWAFCRPEYRMRMRKILDLRASECQLNLQCTANSDFIQPN